MKKIKLLDEKEKKKIQESRKAVKREFNGILKELGISGKSNLKSNEKEDLKNKDLNSEEDKQKENVKSNVAFIWYISFMVCMLWMIFSIAQFDSNKILIGILLLLMIPIIVAITIYICLRYTKTTLKEHLDIINKKIHEVVSSEKFETAVFVVIFAIIFIGFIIMVILVNSSNAGA